LIEDSVDRVNKGAACALDTSKALEEIVSGISQVNQLVEEIASSSSEQALEIGQVHLALQQIESVTQANTTNAEETAAASEELSSQAAFVGSMIGRFRLAEVSNGSNANRRDSVRQMRNTPHGDTNDYEVDAGYSHNRGGWQQSGGKARAAIGSADHFTANHR
jgi:methyl-accepting chemotaxis protein